MLQMRKVEAPPSETCFANRRRLPRTHPPVCLRAEAGSCFAMHACMHSARLGGWAVEWDGAEMRRRRNQYRALECQHRLQPLQPLFSNQSPELCHSTNTTTMFARAGLRTLVRPLTPVDW